MANSFTKIYIHYVFAVKYRHNLIQEIDREIIEKYMTGIVKEQNQKMIAIYCNPDHCHMLARLRPTMNIEDLIRDVKACSSGWIKKNLEFGKKFEWQGGYGAFSIGEREVPKLVNYIYDQPRHHAKISFKDEYELILKENSIEYLPQYLFEYYD